MLTRFACLLASLPLAHAAGQTSVSVQPGDPSVDPQGVLATGQMPLGGSALLRVSGGFRDLVIEDGEDDFHLGGTQGGARADVTVSEALLVANLLQDVPLQPEVEDALDLNRDGSVSIPDLVWVLEYPGDEIDVGGDALAPLALRPDGEGPLAEDDLISALVPRVVLEGDDPVYGEDGFFAGLVETRLVDNLISLVPHPLDARRGEIVTLALQIDSSIGLDRVFGYTARIDLPPDLQFVGFPRGAAENEDFASQPLFVFREDRRVLELGTDVTDRGDTGDPIINVANVDVRVLDSAPVGSNTPIVVGEGTLIPQVGAPITTPFVRLLGCTVQVEPF